MLITTKYLVGAMVLFIGLPEMLRCADKLFVLLLTLWWLLCCGDMPVGDWGPEDDCCGLFFHGWNPFPTAASAKGGGDLFDNLLHWAASIASGVPFRAGCSWKRNYQKLIFVLKKKVSFTCWLVWGLDGNNKEHNLIFNIKRAGARTASLKFFGEKKKTRSTPLAQSFSW